MQLLTDDERALRDVCREVLSAHASSERVRSVAGTPDGHDAHLWSLTTELGWHALALPDRLGGLDGGPRQLALVAEEFGRVVQPSLLPQSLAVSWVLARYGAGSCDDLLTGIGDGSVRASWAAGEPGSQPPRFDGDRLTGRVDFVPDGQCATHILLEAIGPAGTPVLVVVDTRAGGVELSPRHTLDITRRYARLELRHAAADVRRLDLDPENSRAAVRALSAVGLVMQCAESSGVAATLLARTVEYAGQRRQFGQLIGSFQALKHTIASMLIEVEGCRAATREAAERLERGSDVVEATSVAKSFVGRGASFVSTNALQLHGGIGFSWEHDLHLFLRRAKVNELLLGTPEWHDERLAALLVAGASDRDTDALDGRTGEPI